MPAPDARPCDQVGHLEVRQRELRLPDAPLAGTTVTNISMGGQPVSMADLRAARVRRASCATATSSCRKPLLGRILRPVQIAGSDVVMPLESAAYSAKGVLSQSSLFAMVPGGVLDELARLMHRRQFRRNEVIFHQGDPGDSLFLLESGRVKLGVASSDGVEAILVTLKTGDAFGELALIDGAPRSATATAMEPTVALTLHRDRFRAVLQREPDLRDAVLGALAARLRDLTDQVAELHFLDLGGRLGLCLVRLAERELASAAIDPRGPIRLPSTISQSDLAAMIGRRLLGRNLQ